MTDDLPESLISTARLIGRTFGTSIPSEDYSALITLLYEHLSDRNLATVIAQFVKKDQIVVWNDIGRIMSMDKPTAADLDRVRTKLDRAGFSDWVFEE